MIRKTIVLTLIVMLLVACSLPTPAVPAATSTNIVTEPSTPPGPIAAPPSPEPTTVPTGLPGGEPIRLDNLVRVSPVMDTNSDFTSRLAWSLDGQSLAAFQADQITFFRLDPLTVNRVFSSPSPNTLLDLAPDGRSVLVATAGTNLEIKDLTGAVIQTISLPGRAISASFSPDGSRLVVASGEERRVDLLNPADGQLLQSLTGFETAAPVYSASIGADNQTLLWLARASIQAQNITSGQIGPRLEHEDFVGAFELTSDGHLLATAVSRISYGAPTPIIQLWDPASGSDLGVLTLDDIARDLSFSPDGSLMAVSSGTDIQVWDVAARAVAGILSAHTTPVSAVAFSVDGAALASASEDGQIRIWKVSP